MERKHPFPLALLKSLSGIATSVIVFCLIAEIDDWPLEIHHFVYAFAAVLALVCAAIPIGIPKGRPSRLPTPAGAQRFSLSEHGLSPRESLYVRGLLAGETPKEIAAEYHLAPSTVRNGISSALKKLGLTKSAQLYELGIAYEVVA
jgi:DNA-binding CsgD family transcriptional regulator